MVFNVIEGKCPINLGIFIIINRESCFMEDVC